MQSNYTTDAILHPTGCLRCPHSPSPSPTHCWTMARHASSRVHWVGLSPCPSHSNLLCQPASIIIITSGQRENGLAEGPPHIPTATQTGQQRVSEQRKIKATEPTQLRLLATTTLHVCTTMPLFLPPSFPPPPSPSQVVVLVPLGVHCGPDDLCVVALATLIHHYLSKWVWQL